MTVDAQEAVSTNSTANRLAQPAPRAAAARFAHSRAVVIGIDRYQHIRPLNTAVNDAARLAEFLREQHGYDDVLLLEDATHATLAAELGDRLAARAGKDDRVLLYFAGHGIALDGNDGPEGFLVPADAKADDRNTFVAMADLYAWLEALPCRHLLVILDCCFAGAFTWHGRRNLAPIGATLYREHYDRFVREPAWQILTSAAHDQEALDVLGGKPIGVRGEQADDGARHSPFADALFAALQGAGDLIPKGEGDGVVTATELYLYLRQAVEVSAEEEAKHRQTPELWPFSRTRHGKGEFMFLVPGHGEPDLEPAPELTTENNPYRGLQSYDEKHAALFFGRGALIERLAAAVDEHPLTVVLGASGTGKSSVVKAGVVPYLKQRTTEGARKDAKAPGEVFPTYSTLPPMRPGDTPLRVLEELVAASLPGSTGIAAERPDPATFVPAAIDGWLATHPDQRLLLVVDQVEELVTLCREDATRNGFLQTLADLLAAHPDRLRVILTLRTDFEPQFQDSPLFAPRPSPLATRFVVPPMSQAELREVIEAPAAVRVLFFDPPALVDTLIDEVIQTPGALPLLSFTLEQLYLKYIDRQSQAQRGGVTLERSLLRADYDALGGVIGSLRRRADEVYTGLPDDAHRATMQRVMLRMVAVEGGELARRRVMRAELVYAADAENDRVQTVLDRLVSARLLVTGSMDVDGDGVEDTVVEPAHDALVAAWDKLLQWKRQAEEYLPLQRRLWQAASEWQGAPQDRQRGLLWDANPRLPQLEETLWPTRSEQNGLAGRTRWVRQVLWPKTERPANSQWLNQAEVAFVQASVRRRASGLRRIIAATSAVIIVLALALAFADGQRRTAESERTTNLARFFASESQNSTDADLRTLLGIEAVRLLLDNAIKPLSDDVWSALHAAVAESPGLSLDIDAIELGAIGSISFVQNWLAPDSAEWLAVLRHGTGPGAAKLVDLRARQVLHLPELPDDAWRFVFGPTGKSVAAIVEKSVQVLSTAGIAPICSLTHHSYINELAFDPSNTKLLITGGATAALWDIGRCKQMSLLPIPADEHGLAVTRLQFSDDGIYLYAFDKSRVEQWDIANAQRPQLIRKFEGDSVSLSENLERVAVSLNGIVQILDTSDSQPIWTKQITGAGGRVSVHLSPDGRHVTTTQRGTPEKRNLSLWQVDDGVELWHWKRRSMFEVTQWISRADDTLLLAYEDKGDTLHLLNLNTGEALPSSPRFRGAEIARVVAHPAGTHLLIQLNDSSIRLWNLQGGYEEKKLANGAEVLANMAFAPDGSFAATLSRNGTFRTWSTSPSEFLSTDQKPKLLKLVDSVVAIGELPSGDLAIELLDQLAIRGQAVISVAGEISSMDAGAISGHLLLDSYDGDIPISTRALYHLQDTGSLTVELLTRLPPNLDLHSDCQPCISSDGRWLALLDDPSYDQTSSGGAETIAATCEGSLTCVLIWDVDAGQVRAALHHEAEIASNGIAFNPAAPLVATVDQSGIIRLWDIQSQNVQPVELPTADSLWGGPQFMAFTSDGQRLIAGGSFGTLHVWDVDSRRLVKEHIPETPEDLVSPWVDQFRFVSGSNDIVVLVSPNCGSPARDPGSMPGIQIQRWHIDTLQPIGAQLNSQGDCNALFDVVTLDDRLLVGVSTPQNTIEVFDHSAGRKLFAVTTPLPVIDIAFAPGGEYLAAIDQEGRVHQWPMDLQRLLQTACALVGREMQDGERDLYFGEAAPPRTTCEGINP